MSSPALESIFEAFAVWRSHQHERVGCVSELLQRHGVCDEHILQRLHGVMHRLDNPSLRVAFVAEFSRGKSELINAVFFAGMGRRIMPASAGRTTMCPTEIGYDARLAQGLYVLPIETRRLNRSLTHWRAHVQEWQYFPIDPIRPESIAETMLHVTQTIHVDAQQARAMGLGDDEVASESLPRATQEIPQWRHAMLNIDLPLLRQGLVVIDTPGLNAVGVEPELTLGLLHQVDAVVFILAADLGVSQTDLNIWQDHLLPPSESEHNRLVVLNKIDVLWDDLRPASAIEAELTSQKNHVAQCLGLSLEKVTLVSAQKGLVARIKHNEALLYQSQLPAFEAKMAHEVVHQHQAGLERQVHSALAYVVDAGTMQLAARRHWLEQQRTELERMCGQNQSMIHQMRQRLEHERRAFEEACVQVRAIRHVHTRLTHTLLEQVSDQALVQALAQLQHELTVVGMQWAGRRAFRVWFDRHQNRLLQLQSQASEASLGLRQLGEGLQDRLGFLIEARTVLDVTPVIHALDVVKIELEPYFSMRYWWRMRRSGEVKRWVDGVQLRVAPLLERVRQDIGDWTQALLEPIARQVLERERSFENRLEVIERIGHTADSVESRLHEVEQSLNVLDVALAELDAVEVTLKQHVV